MTHSVVSLEERRAMKRSPPNPLFEALDALALALSDHQHQWTERERSLYETAVAYLGFRLYGD